MKKILASFLAITILFSPIGNIIFNDSPVAEAKRFKSGKKSFNMDKQKTPTQSNVKKEKEKKQNETTPAANKKSSGGGLMKGLIAGGLAGLLFGSLFANMGMLGSILGLLVNVFAIIFLIAIIKKVFSLLSAKKNEEEDKRWHH